MKAELRAAKNLGFDRGTTSDIDIHDALDAGSDIGDGNLDGDSDATGTGERATATEDVEPLDRDVRPDRIVNIGEGAGGDTSEEASNLEIENDVGIEEDDSDPDNTNSES